MASGEEIGRVYERSRNLISLRQGADIKILVSRTWFHFLHIVTLDIVRKVLSNLCFSDDLDILDHLNDSFIIVTINPKLCASPNEVSIDVVNLRRSACTNVLKHGAGVLRGHYRYIETIPARRDAAKRSCTEGSF